MCFFFRTTDFKLLVTVTIFLKNMSCLRVTSRVFVHVCCGRYLCVVVCAFVCVCVSIFVLFAHGIYGT